MESMMRRAAAPPSHQPLWVCVSKHAHVRTVRPGARRVHGQAVKHRLRAVLRTAPRDRKVCQWSPAASVEFTVVGVGWGKGRSQWGRGGFDALVPFFHPALARVQVSHATGS